MSTFTGFLAQRFGADRVHSATHPDVATSEIINQSEQIAEFLRRCVTQPHAVEGALISRVTLDDAQKACDEYFMSIGMVPDEAFIGMSVRTIPYRPAEIRDVSHGYACAVIEILGSVLAFTRVVEIDVLGG